MKRVLFSLFVTLTSVYFASTASAQLPELAAASGSGNPTTARFLGGVTADDGVSYGSSFGFDQAIDVLTEIQVEASHVNTVGNLYIIIVLDEIYFMRVESGAYEIWDLALENLQAASPAKTLQSSEPLPIVEDTAFGPAGVSGTTLAIYLAYDTVAAPGELYYSAAPLTFTIEEEVAEAASLTLYKETVSAPIIQANCIVCHTPTGLASATNLHYVDNQQPDFMTTNYNTLINYIQSQPSVAASLLKDRPQGIGHGVGGVRLAPGSSDLQTWSTFVDAAVIDAGI